VAVRAAAEEAGQGKVLLDVQGLKAMIADSEKGILDGVNLTIREGEVCF